MKKILLFALVCLTALQLFAQQKIVGGYFTNWSVYSRKFGVADLPAAKVNQITQAFMFPFVVNGTLLVGEEVVYRGTSKKAVILTCTNFTDDNGVVRTTGVASTDFYADIENTLGSVTHYGTPSWLSGTTNAEKISSWIGLTDASKPGVLGQMVMARTKGIEVIASLGGWTLAQHFPDIAKDINTRAAFAQAVATFASQFKFDGIDFDWEFPVSGGTDGTETLGSLAVPAQPHNAEDPMNMVMLCKAVKNALPLNVKLSIATNQNPHTVAAMYIFPGNKSTWAGNNYKGYDGSDLTNWVDRFYTMTYDYGGSWLSKTSHQAPLYNSGDLNDPDHDMSASAFINKLVDQMLVSPGKIMMGVPFYGRGWGTVAAGSNGDGLYQVSSQGSSRLVGSWDDTAGENSAAFDYGDLKDGKARNLHQYIKDGVGTGNNGFKEYWSDVCKVPYLYNSSTGEFISYDNPTSIAEKTKFAMSKGLAGVFTWEFSQDDRALSLISAMADNAKLYNVTVSGNITAASGYGISGVTVDLTGGDTKSVNTGADGTYTFTVQALKDYTVTFSKLGYTLLPAQRVMTMLSKDSVINVVGSSAAYSISGRVAFEGGVPVNDMELELKSGTKTIGKVTSGSDGTYAFTNVPGDFNYQVIPHSPYYTVTPAGGFSYTALSSNKSNQNITVSYASYSIGGEVTDKLGNAIAGASIVLSGGSTGTFLSGPDGTYTITGLSAKSDYQVSIQIDNIFYSTISVPKPSLAKNETVNFTEYPWIAVFGYVKNGSTPLSGVSLAMTNDWQANWPYNHSATTDSNGFYSFVLPETVSSLTNFTLKPATGTWFPSSVAQATLSSSLRADFNSQEVEIALTMTQPAAASALTNASGKVLLEATASVSPGSISSVKFEVDGQVLTAANTTGTTYQTEWTPSAVFADCTIKVTATTATGAKSTVSKTVYVDCNSNCPNKKPVINLVSPVASSETQASFSAVNISADVTDADGTISTVAFKIDGSAVTPVKSGNTYSYSFTPASYKTYSIEISATDNSAGTTVVSKNYAIRQPSTFTPMPDVAIVGYWHNWASASAPFIPLANLVNSKYTVIDVSFAMQKSTTYDYIAVFTPDASAYPNVQTFKDEVQLLKNAGKVVVLSFGGENGHFSLESLAEKDAFVTSVKGLIDTYGFDGIDIDFEGSAAKLGETSTSLEYATLTSARSKYLIDALKELITYYGDPFVLTFAPELYYVQVGYSTYPGVASGDFLPVLYNLRNEMDLLHVQYYNYGSEWWMGAQKQPPFSAELVTQELELLLTGFPLGSTGNRFPAIAPSKLAIGLPCTCSAAGTAGVDDYNVPIDKMIAGLEYLRTGVKPAGFGYTTKGTYEPIRGMMTWSINWDATTDCSHTPYDFANRYFAYFDGLSNAKPVVSITSPAGSATLSTGTISIAASASDADGSVAKVDFYVNSVKVGSGSALPYSFNWVVSTAGTYKLYAIATDNLGKEGKSAEIEVQVIVPGSPVISLDSPANNSQIMPEDALVLKATATDSDGTIAKVEFFDGTNKLGEDTTSPFEYTWNGATPGVHEITAKATDNAGKTTTTVKTSITVNARFTLSGTVKREDGSAMNGVALSLIGNAQIKYAQTDVNGSYTFTNVLSFKDYKLQPSTSSASVFTPLELSVGNLSANQTQLDFVLNEGVYVHGYVKNGTVPVSGAVVQVVLNWTSSTAPYASTTVTSNADGYYKYMIPDAYVGGAGGNIKMNAWENNSIAYYPASGYAFTSFTKVERGDFNSQQNAITVSILTTTPLDVALGSAVPLQANAVISRGNIETVTFSIDNQVLPGTLDGSIWKANWTPSNLDADYTLSVTATGEGISSEVTKSIRVNCSGTGCANKKPLISLLTPTASIEQQATFVSVPVSASVTDPDGTVSTVKILVDGVEQSVTASGNNYSCSFIPSAYKKYVIEVQATDNSGGSVSLTKEYTVRVPSTFVAFPAKCITGYWHNWENTSAPFTPLRDVLNTKFNVAIVSFIETVNSDGYTPVFEPLGNRYASHAAFKADVKMLQDAGIPVLISIGGQNGHVQLSTEQQKTTFVNGVTAICEEYGFDGLDIDYEGGSMTAFTPESTSLEYSSIMDTELKNGIDAIREIHAYFGNDFLITAAPETAYVQDGRLNYPNGGQFLPFIYNIRDILTCLHVQLYNFGSATWSHMQTVSGTPTSLKAGTADVIVGLTEMLATGFSLGNTGLTFPALREDQIAIGILASPSSGGSIHYTNPAEVKKALNYLIKGEKDPSLTYPLQVKDKYPGIRGVMTWSINWDAVLDGRAVANEFADNYDDYFFGQADTESPVIASFSCNPNTAFANTPVSISVTDNMGVTGYYLVADNNSVPASGASGWTSSKPASITLGSVGSHTLYLWVKDAAGNISTMASTTVYYDGSVPVISEFLCPNLATQATVAVTITATDTEGVTGYYLVADNNSEPAVDASGWSATKPTSITLATEGSHILYLWVKDQAGHISTKATATVLYDVTVPVISGFTCLAVTNLAVVNVAITATDNVGIRGYYLVANNSAVPGSGATGWVTNKPTSITLNTEGSYVLYLWVKDMAENVSSVSTANVIYNATAPVVALSCPATSTSATVSVAITATDNVGVTGYYLVADNSTAPAVGASGWVVTKPTSITLAAEGSHTLYLWVKDAVGNISNVSTASIVYAVVPEQSQEIVLNIGWNIISFNVIPVHLDLKTIFQSLVDVGKLKKVIDETGKTIENFGAFGGWRNTIGNSQSAKGYKVNVTTASTLTVKGVSVSLPMDINLIAGWNIISYPGASLQDAKALFQPLIDAGKLKKVMDEAGKTIENLGIFGGWKNNIGNVVPGRGYKVYVSGNCTLTIPASGNKSAVIAPQLIASSYFKPAFVGCGTDHMSIYLIDLQTSGLLLGDEIGVFDGAVCVGSATIGANQLQDGSICIAASGNDGLGATANGFTSGHPVELQLYRNNQLNQTKFTKIDGNELFEKDGSLLLQVNSILATGVQDISDLLLFECYPNPFAREITIEVRSSQQAEISVDIYDLSGQLIKNLYKGTDHSYLVMKWDGTSSSGKHVYPGVYFCKVNDRVSRLIKLK